MRCAGAQSLGIACKCGQYRGKQRTRVIRQGVRRGSRKRWPTPKILDFNWKNL
jgi:hypothetical protein